MLKALLFIAGCAVVVLSTLGAAASPSGGALPDFDRLWDWDHPEKTEARFRELVPRARESGDRDYLAQLLTQLARTQSLQRKFAEAHRILDEVERMLGPEMKVARVRYCLERGRAFNSAGQPDRARPLFQQAWEVAQAAGAESYAIDAAHMLGIVEPDAKALEWDLRAIALAEKSKDPKVTAWLGPLYNNTGGTYFDDGNYPKACEYLEKAYAFYKKHGSRRQIRIAKHWVAKTYRKLGRLDEALRLQEEVLHECEAMGDPTGYAHEEIGECLLALHRPDEAKPHFVIAYEILAKDPELSDEPARLARLKQLARGE